MEIKEEEDSKFILNPNEWPNWPFLPMKNRREKSYDIRVGVIAEVGNIDEWPRIIYLDMNIFDVHLDLAKAQKKVYNSIEALLNDGWEVD